jgi:CBS domain-containing protein
MLRVRELMSAGVVAVPASMSLHELARVLAENAISGVPVVDDERRVVGVVSESDIVEKERGPDEESYGRLARLLGRHPGAAAYATTAGEAMSSPPIVVEPWMSVYEAAWLMSIEDVNRLPVVESGRLVGVISRADLVRYFARPDADIAQDVGEELTLLSLYDLEVAVEQGHVVLRGEVDDAQNLGCLRHAISRIPGVVSVKPMVTVRRVGEREASVR